MQLGINVWSLLICFGLAFTGIQAQESIVTSGGNANGEGGNVSFSIGQMNYSTHTSSTGNVAQGVQQAYEISNITGIKNNSDISLNVSAYPNPTIDHLILDFKEVELQNVAFDLYNMQGKLLRSQKITEGTTSIAMDKLAPASYVLHVVQGNKQLKTFKIVKH